MTVHSSKFNIGNLDEKCGNVSKDPTYNDGKSVISIEL